MGGMYVSDGITVYTGGMSISQGLTITTSGLDLAAGGMTVADSGIVLPTGGLTVLSGGVYVYGGSTIVGDFNLLGGLTVSGGDVYFANSYTVFSDERLKDDIEPLTEPLAKIRRLRGVYYHWNPDPEPVATPESSWNMTTRVLSMSKESNSSILHDKHSLHGKFDDLRHIGVIAQDVRDVLPEATAPYYFTDGGTEYIGVKYSQLIPLLIEGVKELDAKRMEIEERRERAQENANERCNEMRDKMKNVFARIDVLMKDNERLKGIIAELI